MWTERCPDCKAPVLRVGRPNQREATDFKTTIVCRKTSHLVTTEVTQHSHDDGK